MKHWPWQHQFTPIAAEHVVCDYLGTARLEKGIGSRETIVLLKCECKKVKTRRLQGHWTREELNQAFS